MVSHLCITTPPTDLPGPPLDVNAVLLGANSAMVSWLPPTDTGSCPITSYAIQRKHLQADNWEEVRVCVCACACEECVRVCVCVCVCVCVRSVCVCVCGGGNTCRMKTIAFVFSPKLAYFCVSLWLLITYPISQHLFSPFWYYHYALVSPPHVLDYFGEWHHCSCDGEPGTWSVTRL